MTDQTGGNTTPRRDSFKRTLGLASLVAVAVGIVVGQGPIVSAMQGVLSEETGLRRGGRLGSLSG